MADIAKMSALELKEYIDRSDGPLREALEEIDRLRDLLVDIVDEVNTSSSSAMLFSDVTPEDSAKLLNLIDDIAHRYYRCGHG